MTPVFKLTHSLVQGLKISLDHVQFCFFLKDGSVESFCDAFALVALLVDGSVQGVCCALVVFNDLSLLFDQPGILIQFEEKLLHEGCVVLSRSRQNKE